MNNVVEKIDTQLNSILNDFVRKPTIIRGIVHLLLVLYVVRLAPTPPKAVLQLFENVYFKLAMFSLVLWTAQFSPSTSILIALAFMVTVNYTTTGKVWEMMDNIGHDYQPPANPLTAIEAVQILSDAAGSPDASSPSVIVPIANAAASAATTKEGVNAIKALAEQAVTPESGTEQNVAIAATVAIESITLVQEGQAQVKVTGEQSVEAVKALVIAAASESAISIEDITPVVQIALANTTTQEGADSIKALAQQASTAEAGVPEKVADVALVAIESIKAVKSEPTVAQSGCFPVRQYDMTKVSPQTAGQFSFEDYQQFTASPQ
jgi:hypothetical protein